MEDITPQYQVPSFEQEVIIAPDFGMGDTIGGWAAGSGELAQGRMRLQSANERILIGAATDILTGTGIFMGNDGAASPGYDFRVGNPSGNYMHWDESAGTLLIAGSISAGTIDIGGSDATSFHVDVDGNMWLGASTFAAAPAKISNAGAATFSSVTITGGAISGTPISGIPNNSSTDISLLEKTHTMVFSVTDLNTIAWTSGTITLSNGRTFSINSGNTGNMAALTYIYLDPGVSTTALQTTTTASTAMGANKILLGVAQNNAVTASFIPYGPGQALIDGAQIGALSITAGNIAATTITAAKMSVSQLSAIAADMGTITAGTVTGATIRTAASGTRFNMTSTAFQGINASGNVIFEIILTGTDIGDVIMGDDATGTYAKWDNSAGTFSVFADNVPVLSQGYFGGDGSDGALSISSGTTTISAASASTLVKNYTSISITSTGKLAFSNPHAGGTFVTLKSQGAVTLTSTQPAIDTRGMGAQGGSASTSGTAPNGRVLSTNNPAGVLGGGSPSGSPGTAGTQYDMPDFYTSTAEILARRYIALVCGAGGGGGGSGATGTGGTGGRGGGALLIECNGALNFTGSINSSGSAGSNATGTGGAGNGAGGGGGGSAGMVAILYNTLTSASGTITATGGNGGDGNTNASGGGTLGYGGGGAGSITTAGGAGAGGNAGGTGAGGGGGNGNGAGGAVQTGGTGSGSMGGLVAKNVYFA